MVKHKETPDQATIVERIRSAGARVTNSRVAVFSTLLGSEKALTQGEVEAALEGMAIDRVTVYRILDWLAEHGLAHRIADGERALRFSASEEAGEPHAHFKCRNCHGVFCMPPLPMLKVPVPRGFRVEEMDLTVHGLCAACSP